MAGKVHYIYGQPTPIGHFVRVGYNGHRQLETLFARGRFAPDRVVIEAARFDTQREPINTLSATGTEIVIDPTVAELSSVGRFEGAPRAWRGPTRHDHSIMSTSNVQRKERFDAGVWRRRPRAGGGGQNGRLYLPGIDRHYKLADVRAIMKARGGRRLLACQDRDCCPRGLPDMLNDPKAHFLTQRRKQLLDLQRMPDLRRTSRFLDYHLASADRTARQVAKPKIPDDRIQESLRRTTLRLDRLRAALEEFDRTVGKSATRSVPLATRARVSARGQDQGS